MRKTIGSVINTRNEHEITEVINSLFVETNLSANDVGSEDAKSEALHYENKELETHLLPFNIENNYQPKLRCFLAELTRLRKCIFNENPN